MLFDMLYEQTYLRKRKPLFRFRILYMHVFIFIFYLFKQFWSQ